MPFLPFVCRPEPSRQHHGVAYVLYENPDILGSDDANEIQHASVWAAWWIHRTFAAQFAHGERPSLEEDHAIGLTMGAHGIVISPDSVLGVSYLSAADQESDAVVAGIAERLRGLVPDESANP